MLENKETHLVEKNFTLNMAKSRLSVGYTKNNSNFVNFWEQNNTYHKANKSLESNGYKKYVLLDGPPYANGPLHLGHALNKNFKDLLVKSRWYMGQPVDFRPGWDCHGLPLELAVEKKYGRKDPAEMKVLCKELALSSVESHKVGFKSLGVLADWENPYLTLSDENLTSNWETLADLLDKDLLVYKQYPVHYCADCGSSLASAELETKLLEKDSLYFKMKLLSSTHENLYAVVWTTTPWTVPMNQGLAYRNESDYNLFYSKNLDEYLLVEFTAVENLNDYLLLNEFLLVSDNNKLNYFNLSGAVQPLTKENVPLLSADFVEAGKTGFVHLAFAHGPEDFELGVKFGYLPKTYLGKHGVFETSNVESLKALNGLSRQKSRDVVLQLLGEANSMLVVSTNEQEQNVCWRHKKDVYYNATWQVFLDLQSNSFNLKDRVKVLLEDSELNKKDKEQLSLMLLNRDHWCLSRQRSWGCEMNLLVDKNTSKVSPLSSKYLRLLVNGENLLAKKMLDDHPNLFVFKDVLDVWFDSGNVVNTYKKHHGAQTDKFVVNMALEGKDQYRGWFQAMMWLCVAKNNMLPYQNLFCHGFVLNTEKEKFSKSAGNAKSVDYYVENYGADVLHLWVASQESGKDAVFSEVKLKEMNSLYSRLRLTLRFLTSNLYDYDVKEHNKLWNLYKEKEDFDLGRYVLSEVNTLHKLFVESFSQYDFKTPLESLYEFTNKTLSNFFFDCVKNPLYLRKLKSEDRLKLQVAMFELLKAMFDMVKVYAPFVAEEFYLDFFGETNSVFEVQYFDKTKEKELNELKVLFDWERLTALRKEVSGKLEPLQKAKEVKARTEVAVKLSLLKEDFQLLKNLGNHYRLRELFNVSEVFFMEATLLDVNFDVLVKDESYQKCHKCWGYALKDLFTDNLCSVCQKDELE